MVYDQVSSTQRSSIQAGAHVAISNARVISLRQTVKYSTHCKKDYHSADECYVKHFKLASSLNSAQPATKSRRGGGDPNKKSDPVREED